jgi:hypothetical protein
LWDEIRGGLTGALLLARGEPAAMGWFDLTIPGFWRSFMALALAYPGFVVMAWCERALLASPPAAGSYLAWESLAYVCEGAAFPAVMILLARMLRLEGTYVPFIIAYNWSGVWVTALLLPPLALLGFGLVGFTLGGLLNLAASIAAVYYRWTVTRVSLATGGFTALGLVIVDTLLSIGIAMAARQFYAPAA